MLCGDPYEWDVGGVSPHTHTHTHTHTADSLHCAAETNTTFKAIIFQ